MTPVLAAETTPAGAAETPRSPEPVLGGVPISSALGYLSARVPRMLRDELQHQAIREGRPVAKLLVDAVTAYLDAHSGTRA
jgi:hypothetical protein